MLSSDKESSPYFARDTDNFDEDWCADIDYGLEHRHIYKKLAAKSQCKSLLAQRVVNSNIDTNIGHRSIKNGCAM